MTGQKSGFLYRSSTDSNRILKWSEETGQGVMDLVGQSPGYYEKHLIYQLKILFLDLIFRKKSYNGVVFKNRTDRYFYRYLISDEFLYFF